MNLKNTFSPLMKAASKSGWAIQKASPEILLGVGIVGIVASTVLACKATLKVENILDIHHEKTEKVHNVIARIQEGEIDASEYTAGDQRKDLGLIYVQTTWGFVKLYGPSVSLGLVSLACIVGGHRILKSRNIALMAAYQTLEKGFVAYRKRVIEEHGEEADYMYKNGLRYETVMEEEVNEKGKVKQVPKQKIGPVDPNGISIYAKFFDEGNPEWVKDSSYNFLFLKAQQSRFNDLLHARGHVFLNEVYTGLGFEHTKEGAIVGWISKGNGDGFIDFGIFDGDRPKVRDFVNGYERSILLDFNVDGVIYDRL